jgi:spermidine/putrescine transport system permease protein
MMIYSMAKLGVNPKMNALTTLLFAAVLVLMVLSNLSSIKKTKKRGVKK